MSNSIDTDLLRRLDSVLERLVRRMKVHSEIHKTGMTATQLFVMRYLSIEGEAKSSDISKTAGLSPGAITQVCDELVRLGYVERGRSNEDRRVVNIRLTDSGRQQLQALLNQRTRHLKELMDKLGEEDARQLMGLLEKLVDVMEVDSDGSGFGRQ